MKPIFLACNVDLTHKSKDGRVVVSAEDVIPMWKSILQRKFVEVVGVELSQSHLDTLLGSANSPGHGIICIKCTKYKRLKREILALEENTTNAVSGIIRSTFETVAVTPERAGQKRTCMQDSHIQDHSPAKKLHLSFPSRAPSMAYVTDCLPAIVLSSKL